MRDLKTISQEESINYLNTHLPKSRFSITDSISDGYETWKKQGWTYIGFVLIFIALLLPISLIPYLGGLANNLLISPALSIGVYYYSHKVTNNQSRELGDLSKGFEYIRPLITAGIVTYSLTYLITSPDSVVNFFSSSTGITSIDLFNSSGIVFKILFVIISLYILVLEVLIPLFIVFFNLSGWEAIKQSFKYLHKNLMYLFGLTILVILIVGSGVLGLIIGIFVTTAMSFPMFYHAFRQMTNLDEFLSEEESAGQSPMDHLSMDY